MTHYFKDDDKDVVNNGTASTDQRNMYPNAGINAAAAVAASRHPVSSINILSFNLISANTDLEAEAPKSTETGSFWFYGARECVNTGNSGEGKAGLFNRTKVTHT